MAQLDDSLAQGCIQAIRSSAEPLGLDALALAQRLRDGEIARLLRLLNAALPHVTSTPLRHRIEDILSSVTDGSMPMFEKPESELDWALETLRRRREVGDRGTAEEEEEEEEEEG